MASGPRSAVLLAVAFGAGLAAAALAAGGGTKPQTCKLVLGAPAQLAGRYATGGVRTGYDVSPDGQTFLMVKLLQPRENLSQFNLVMNWFDTIRQRPPSAR